MLILYKLILTQGEISQMATTLSTQISALATQVGTDIKQILANVGDLSQLTRECVKFCVQ